MVLEGRWNRKGIFMKQVDRSWEVKMVVEEIQRRTLDVKDSLPAKAVSMVIDLIKSMKSAGVKCAAHISGNL